jgi:hypothetical protein
MRSPTQSTVCRAIACDKASKSNMSFRQLPVLAETVARLPQHIAAITAGQADAASHAHPIPCLDDAAPPLPHSEISSNLAFRQGAALKHRSWPESVLASALPAAGERLPTGACTRPPKNEH